MNFQNKILTFYFSYYKKKPSLKAMSKDLKISPYRLSKILNGSGMMLEEFEKIRFAIAIKSKRIMGAKALFLQ